MKALLIFEDTKRNMKEFIAQRYALLCHQIIWMRFRILNFLSRHWISVTSLALVLCASLSLIFLPEIQYRLELQLTRPAGLSNVRSLLLTLGGALIGAAVIAFSLVMFAMQVNIERMPYGLFRQFNSDTRIIAAFGSIFLIAVLIASASLIPDRSWMAVAALVGGWGTITIFFLFLYAYQRALRLINPTKQLGFVVDDTVKEFRIWTRRAERSKPLFEQEKDEDGATSLRSSHDMSRYAYFQANPHWTLDATRAIRHAMSYARRYAEQDDHEIAETALTAVIRINSAYVEAKGKTFFADHLLSTSRLSTDAFINDTLEHLRKFVRFGVNREDEQQIEQALQAIAALVPIYLGIDYSNPHASKTHAHLAAGYLSGAVQSVVPYNMPNVLMEGVRLMGRSAIFFLANGNPNDISTLADNIGSIACGGIETGNHQPVTLTAVEQIAILTLALFRTKSRNIRYASRRLGENISNIAKWTMRIPDTPISNAHSMYLAPYYSGTSTETLQVWLTNLTNEVLQSDENDEGSQIVIRNIECWADGLHRPQKELLLMAIQIQSHFTFDIIHWIAHLAKLLYAISNAPACKDYLKEKLEKHSIFLASVLSFIPDNKETVSFVENLGVTEIFFDLALEGQISSYEELSETAHTLLFSWAFKAGKFQSGWAILEQSIYGLSALALHSGSKIDAERLKQMVATQLASSKFPDQNILVTAARDIRRRAATLYREGHWSSGIEHAMSRVNQDQLRPLLEDLANLLSPDTANEPVKTDFL